MSTLLYRIGKTAFRRPWFLVGGWLLVLAVVLTVLSAGTIRVSSEVRMDGTPAQEVLDELATRLPEASGGQVSIVLQAPAGERLDAPANAAAVAAAVDAIFGADHVLDPRKLLAAQAEAAPPTGAQTAPGADQPEGAPGPLLVGGQPVPGAMVSGDGRVAMLQVPFTDQIFELPPEAVDDVASAAEGAAAGTGIVVQSGATLGIPDLLGTGEVLGIVVAAIVLVISLGSLLAAGLPLLSALIGVAIGVGGAFALSNLIQMHSMSVVLALMLGLAVGIDYALFIVNRQRRLILDQHLNAHEAAGRAVGTAGSAVFFAGLTVIIALVALVVVDISLLTTMALVAAATVALAVLIALTLVPALMGLLGERICSPGARARHDRRVDTPHHATPAERWGRLLIRHRYLAVGAVVAVTGVVALPMAGMHLGLPSGQNYDAGTSQRQTYDAVAESFGAGYNGPLLIVATSTTPEAPIDPNGVAGLVGSLSGIDGVAAVSPSGASANGDTVVLTLIPTTGPTDQRTQDLVQEIRTGAPTYAENLQVDVGVTGITAMSIDISERLGEVLPLYLAVVAGLSLLVLLLVFRSIIVPIKATVGFLLSILATFGATTAVFQWGWFKDLLGFDATTPVLSFLPIIVTGVLYGLAMDYEVFLVSSMRESYVHGHHGTETVVQGLQQASRVVAAAAVIMTSVFAGFVFSHDPMIKQIGFALSFGILADAFLVRMTLVPAVMAVFGDAAWKVPGWLDRMLPRLDIEGDRLITSLRAQSQEDTDTGHPVTTP
ncbi:MMPL family transporter [Actinotalea subterranea]|uniref:MMPL family transporter n=1 Tax=Actinotalea subterranea TaxID=2607497 RepID=UPI0011EBE12A|nr:MMPL family transporter [Actinotalea subterranea]